MVVAPADIAITKITTAQIGPNLFILFSSKKTSNQNVRADVAGNKREILILTLSTKPMLFFLLFITLTLRPSSCYRLAGVIYATGN
jgi:hypothetical protein